MPREGLTEAPSESTSQTFPQKLKELREDKGLSQVALAQHLQRSPSLISLLESGGRHPTRAVIQEVSAALGLSDEQKLQLFKAAGYGEDEITTALQALVTTIDRIAQLDDADRALMLADLKVTLASWQQLAEGRKLLREGETERSLEHFQRMEHHREYSPAVRAYARVSLADVSLKLGLWQQAKTAIGRAFKIIQHLPDNWAVQLHAEALAVQGTIAQRAGRYQSAERLFEESRSFYKKLRHGLDANDAVARQGTGKSYKRLAEIELLKGEPLTALDYCDQAEANLRDMHPTSSRDLWMRRVRELKAWAYSRLGDLQRSIALHEQVRDESAAAGDIAGATRGWLYLGDDYLRAVERAVRKAQSQPEVITPEQRRHAIHEVLRDDTLASHLKQAESCYQQAEAGSRNMRGQVLLGRWLRGWATIERLLAVLSNGAARDERYARARDLLEEALQEERRIEQGRRIPLIYESLAELTWDWGKPDVLWRERVARLYDSALKELASPLLSSSDPAGQEVYERVQNARERLSHAQIPARLYSSQATAPQARNKQHDWRDWYDLSASSRWRELSQQLIDLLYTTLINDHARFYAGSDHSIGWVKALAEFEAEHGDRILAQNRLSLSLSLISPGWYSTEAAPQLRKRYDLLRQQLDDASTTASSPRNALCRDLCYRLAVEQGLEDRDTHSRLLDQIKQARDLLQTYPGRYTLVASPYSLPVGFAAKGNLVLVEMPSSLARQFFGDSATNLDVEQNACYRIAGNQDLMQRLSQLFDDLVEEAHRGDLYQGTAKWLDDLLLPDASRREQASGLLNGVGL
ncbi:MAG: helix-turn-helix domain-containing protein [Ktedonobacterales bacterium]